MLLDWFVNPDHAPCSLPQARGYFAQHGLEVELIAPADPNDPPKLVAAGKADVAVSYQPQLHLQVARGLPLKRFRDAGRDTAQLLGRSREGPVKSIADLRGRKVGYSVGGSRGGAARRRCSEETRLEHGRHRAGQCELCVVARVDIRTGRCGDRGISKLRAKSDGNLRAIRATLSMWKRKVCRRTTSWCSWPTRPSSTTRGCRASCRALEAGVQYLVNHPQASWELVYRRVDPSSMMSSTAGRGRIR